MNKSKTALTSSTASGLLDRAGVLQLTSQLIDKVTGQKTVKPDYSTNPYVSTGSTIVDHLIGGQLAADGKGPICPGFPRRRITEVYGPESSGKTTFALASIVSLQRIGGVAMYLDFEHALHFGYAKTIGVDFDENKLLFYQPETLEDGLKMIYLGARTGVDLIVVDSVAAMVPAAEFKKAVDETAKIGGVAKAMSENLPKLGIWLAKPVENRPDHPGAAVVFLNQTRAVIQAGGGKFNKSSVPSENTAGGKALKFYAYLRLRLSRKRSDYIDHVDPMTGKKQRIPWSNVTSVQVVKNKISATQGQSGEIFIRYGYGLDDYMSIIEAGVARKIIGKSGSSYTFNGESFRGKEALRKMLIERPELTQDIRAQVQKAIFIDAKPVIEKIEQSPEDAILSDMRRDIGDDDLVEAAGDDPVEEEVENEDGEA
jgi:recombination protein RecA